jgi:hypothetical protein
MKTPLIPTGASRGVGLPKQTEMHGVGSFRADWDEAFATMALQGDDALLDSEEIVLTHWNEEEWEWQ